ncbi:hypothetical protein L208DRAFT_1380429 [Tricholoma matsutake]|nr:hypothetical protein L208DRAFT_1380429 [Tricholoma matsutake 945]
MAASSLCNLMVKLGITTFEQFSDIHFGTSSTMLPKLSFTFTCASEYLLFLFHTIEVVAQLETTISHNSVVHTHGSNYFADIIRSGTSSQLMIVITPSGPGQITLSFELYHLTIIMTDSVTRDTDNTPAPLYSSWIYTDPHLTQVASSSHSGGHCDNSTCMCFLNDDESITEPESDDMVPQAIADESVRESETEDEAVVATAPT